MRLASMIIAAACAASPVAVVPATPAAAQAAVTVARYSFDAGLGANGTIADQSGRGMALHARSAEGGALRFEQRGTGRAVIFPTRCDSAAARCARVILEGGDDADLDPGTRAFRYGASVRAAAAQVGAGANVMQKGVATAQSQWKLQIGRKGKPNCAVVGRGSARIYLAKASVSVADGNWHRMECRRTSTSLTIFVDGNARGTIALPSGTNIGNEMPLRIGGRALNGRADQFGGALDDVYAALG